MWLSFSLPLALAAAVVEALIGYPAPLYRAIGHPVTWMGRLARLAGGEPQSPRRGLRRAPGGGRRSRFASISRRSPCRLGGDPPLPFGRSARFCRARPSCREPAGAAQPCSPCEGGGRRARRAVSMRGASRSRRSSGAIRTCWTRRASRARRSKAWRRIFPTALSRRSFGQRLAVSSAARSIRRSTPPTA